ncbi:MAG: tetratricopeptide repeat protein [Gammaproteobacteria bacterium]|nr:tetratricopeptide repeat protein [Gammaproteobacteria bacterium]
MIALIVVVALIAVVTVFYLVRPILRGAAVTHEGYHQLVQLRERLLAQLRELDIETGDANIDPAVAADERLRLEGELARALKELDEFTEVPAPAVSGSPVTRSVIVVVVAALVLLVPAGLYWAINYETFGQLAQPQTVQSAGMPPMVLQMVARLEQKLRDNPNDAEGWAKLGRSYEVLGRPDDARQAYVHAYRFAPNRPEIIAAYAAFLMSRDPANPDPEAVALFGKLYKLNPKHPAALWTLGLVAFKENKFKQAAQYWERLLKELPPDSEVTPQVQRALEAARLRAAKK